MSRRVVVTGQGVISPIGNGKDAFWNALKIGENGIRPIASFDTTEYKAKLAAEVLDFDPTDYMEKKEARRMDRFCQFAVAAAKLCMDDANIDLEAVDRERFGVMIGSGVGGLQTMCSESAKLDAGGPRKVSPFMIPMIIVNLAPGHVAIRYGLKGHCASTVTACATSANAIGDAFRMIKDGYVDRMLAGGSEAVISPFGIAGFTNMTALSTSDDVNRASIPFDKERSGFIMGEGGAVLLLEEYEMAKARGAKIYGEVLGYGSTCDAYHITAPDPEGYGAIRAISEALKEGGISPEDVDYINAHGTSTPLNDRMETEAIKAVFGEQAYKIPISSTKSMTGHTLGAAGALEGIVCLQAMEHGFVPPTINYRDADPDCDLNYVPNVGYEHEVQYALTNSFGFGGHNVTLLFGRCDD